MMYQICLHKFLEANYLNEFIVIEAYTNKKNCIKRINELNKDMRKSYFNMRFLYFIIEVELLK